MKRNLFRAPFLLVVIWLIFISTACNMLGTSFKGSQVKPAAAAPDINLSDYYGGAFQLSALQGKVVLVFFGFTNCVDECPLMMAKLKQALENIGKQSSDTQVAMVSTDPVRDTPQALQDFLGKFNPNFLGLTGNTDQLTKTWADYGVTVLNGGETHSSYIYVIDKYGNLRLTLDADLTPEDIAHDLNILLNE